MLIKQLGGWRVETQVAAKKRHRSRALLNIYSKSNTSFFFQMRIWNTDDTWRKNQDQNGTNAVQAENPSAVYSWSYARIQAKVRLSLSGRSAKWTGGCMIHLRGFGTYIHMPPIHRGKIRVLLRVEIVLIFAQNEKLLPLSLPLPQNSCTQCHLFHP